MKILITNDDGFDAAGLETLENVAAEFGRVYVVAPLKPHSGCGHQVTFTGPLNVHEYIPGKFSVDGTPADCVRLAISELVGPVDWVISGINHGSNLGNDIYMSGTVAAAREATWQNQSAIALSQYHPREMNSNWDWSQKLARKVLGEFLNRHPGEGRFWNINFPMPQNLNGSTEIPAIRDAPIDPSAIPSKYAADNGSFYLDDCYHSRPRKSNHDIETCFGGQISVTLL